MKQEDKDLLLRDLCARLPYEVKIQYEDNIFTIDYISAMYEEIKLNTSNRYTIDVLEVKPYLFPLSSMTEEHREEFLNIQTEERQILLNALIEYKSGKYDKIPIIAPYKQIEWLNKNHFDYRGLIEKGLAIDATGLNIY